MSESHPRQGVTGRPREPEGKDSSAECPFCGIEYSSPSGVSYHIRQEHQDQMLECGICGKFCRNKRGLSVHEAKEHPNAKKDLTCDMCGSKFTVKKSREDKARFCSSECSNKWFRTVFWPGKRHENWYDCIVCGRRFRRADYDEHAKCCSNECAMYYMKHIRVGEDHHGWMGGGENYYGGNWNQKRRECLDRDNHTCQDCGTTESLHVHHIQPLRTFDEPEEANNLRNLVTLCETCHLSKWEGIPLRPDTR